MDLGGSRHVTYCMFGCFDAYNELIYIACLDAYNDMKRTLPLPCSILSLGKVRCFSRKKSFSVVVWVLDWLSASKLNKCTILTSE